MTTEFVETLVIGGGQAGLAMSHMLGRQGCEHLVLERGRIAERWRSERWDGLRFQFPNWSVRLPEFPFADPAPDAFATSAEILNYLEAYAAFVAPPIRCGVEVTALRRDGERGGFAAETSAGPIRAANVVVATGPYQRPVIPPLLSDNAGVFQIHASQYRNPDQLPTGAVLVIGSGASGAQIAEELLHAGRRVYLAVGRHRRMPRRYRGHDLIWWLAALGLDQTPVEKRGPDRALPLITGAYGGHTIDFREFAERGITLLGRIDRITDGIASIRLDLADSIAYGDRAYSGFVSLVDAHVEQNGLDLPIEAPKPHRNEPSCIAEPIRQLDLHDADITAIVWATGYGMDYRWIDLPVLDERGEPIHRHGVANEPGLYFLGLPWLSKMNSSFLAGIGDDAARLASHVAARSRNAGDRSGISTSMAVST